MARQCMRPGCDRLAAARLTYDTESAAVWLDTPAPDSEPAQQVCSVHAATLTAPLGWTVTDRRLMSVGPSDHRAHPSLSEREPLNGTSAHAGVEAGALVETVEVVETVEPEPELATEPELTTEFEREPAIEPKPEPAPAAARNGAPRTGSSETGSSGTSSSGTGAARPGNGADRPGNKDSKSKERPSLLDRAFEWTGPQHSVLTTERGVRRDPVKAAPVKAAPVEPREGDHD